jgi:predicted RNA binding protein YcfA (HicA-like mRNA interferase family)
MKQKELRRLLRAHGCRFLREGGRHEIWINPQGERFPVPRGTVKQKSLLAAILKQAGLED